MGVDFMQKVMRFILEKHQSENVLLLCVVQQKISHFSCSSCYSLLNWWFPASLLLLFQSKSVPYSS